MQGARRRTYVGRSGIVGSRSRRLVVVTMERPEIVVAGHRVAGIVGEERLSASHHFRHPVQVRRWRQEVLYVTRTHAQHTRTRLTAKQETVSGSGISWAICKSAPRSRQITTPATHRAQFFTGRMLFLPPNQQRQSTEGMFTEIHNTSL